MHPPTSKLPPKKDVLEAFLANGTARIYLDPRRAEVVVPPAFVKQAELVLRVGYTMSVPIPDLRIEQQQVVCTLTFNKVPFQCWLPWTAIFAIISDVDGRGVVWPEDVPLETQLLKPTRSKATRPRTTGGVGSASQGASPAGSSASSGSNKSGASSSNGLARTATPRAPAATPSKDELIGPEEKPQKTKRQLPPYLRVVK